MLAYKSINSGSKSNLSRILIEVLNDRSLNERSLKNCIILLIVVIVMFIGELNLILLNRERKSFIVCGALCEFSVAKSRSYGCIL